MKVALQINTRFKNNFRPALNIICWSSSGNQQ